MEKTNQCKIHGPELSVEKRIVTLSPLTPALTTSRRTGFLKLYTELPALRITSKACYKWVQIIEKSVLQVEASYPVKMDRMLFEVRNDYWP